MEKGWQKGAGNLDAFLIIGVCILVLILTPHSSAPSSSLFGTSTFFNADSGFVPGYTTSSQTSTTNFGSQGIVYGTQITNSSYANSIYINTGNAPYSYEPNEEYITLDNNSNQSIDITGWQLRNGKDKRLYYQSGKEIKYDADTATIPQASSIYSSIYSPLKDIVLNPGERAVVTTGNMPIRTPFAISSFKENICTGYIENHPDYNFSPPLYLNCPSPENEPGLANLDNQCRDFVRFMPSCANPTFNTRDSNGDICTNCVNGQHLSSPCVAFIKEHFSYQGCMIYHGSDKNFEGNTWRIFLNRGWDMWADKYESIELFDRLGHLVNYVNY